MTAYAIATGGCNLWCSFCQNWEISQWPKQHLTRHTATSVTSEPICPRLSELDRDIPGEPVTPRQVVAAALASGATAIAYTYIEPTIFYEPAYDTAQMAREQGLKNMARQQNLWVNSGSGRAPSA